MQNTAVIELFGSFFLSIASQHDQKDLLLKHLANFKGALYSNQQQQQTLKYLDRLQKQVDSRIDKKGAAMTAIKAFEKANRFVYGHIRKVAVVGADGGEGKWQRPGSVVEPEGRKYLNSSQYAQRGLVRGGKEGSDPQLRHYNRS